MCSASRSTRVRACMLALQLASSHAAGKNFTNPLTTPEGIAKLKANPKTAAFFSQPDFVAKLEVRWLRRLPRAQLSAAAEAEPAAAGPAVPGPALHGVSLGGPQHCAPTGPRCMPPHTIRTWRRQRKSQRTRSTGTRMLAATTTATRMTERTTPTPTKRLPQSRRPRWTPRPTSPSTPRRCVKLGVQPH